MTAPTTEPGIPHLPNRSRDLGVYEVGDTFLGWTFCTLSRLTRRISWYFIRPEGTLGIRCASRMEALNYLRGPAGLPALVPDEDH